MTAKPPSASSLTPDTPTDTTATVTFTEIRDSRDQLVGQNTTTYDKTLTGKGTAGPNTELWLRDRVTRFDEVTSGSSGSWIKTFTLSAFKRYSLTAIEKNPPQDFSSPARTFLLATETPIINTVVGDEGPIQSGDTYYGDSVEITGNAPPDVVVTAFSDANSLGTATVNADGFFELLLDGLTPDTYNIKIRAPDGKESATFILIVAASLPLSLDDVIDDEGESVGEGESTFKKTLTIKGKARGKGVITLKGGLPASIPVTAEESGDWEHTFADLADGPYSLTAETNYLPSETAGPRTFTVASKVELSLDDVTDSNGTVGEGETTYDDTVTVSGRAQPDASVQLRNNGTPISGATNPADSDGKWEISLDVTPGQYSLTAEALSVVTAPPRTFTVAVAVELSLDDVLESEAGPSVPEGDTTYKDNLIIRGHAQPGASVQLLNHDSPIEDATATADPTDGAWEIPIDVTAGPYSLTAEAQGEKTAPPRTFTVASTERPHITHVTDSDGPIEDNGDTPYNFVVVRGTAASSEGIRINTNGVTGPTIEPTDDEGKWACLRAGLEPGTRYQFIAVAAYDDNPESAPPTINALLP